MNVLTRPRLAEAAVQYQEAAGAIAAWLKITEKMHWTCFNDVRATFPDADNVDDCVVFNIRGNRYRLITRIRYSKKATETRKQTKGHVYVRSFLTHKDYGKREKWNCEVL